jgi:hypothetical protein
MVSRADRMKIRAARALEYLDARALKTKGSESLQQLEAALALGGLPTTSQPAITIANTLGTTADPTAAAGVAGYIGSGVTTNGLVLADPRRTITLYTGQTIELIATLTAAIVSPAGPLECCAQLVYSTDAGATWVVLGKLMGAHLATSAPNAELVLNHAFVVTAATNGLSHIFAILIGGNLNTAGGPSVKAVGSRRNLLTRLYP